MLRRNFHGNAAIMLFQGAEHLADLTLIMKRMLGGMHQCHELAGDQQGNQNKMVSAQIDQQFRSLDAIDNNNRAI